MVWSSFLDRCHAHPLRPLLPRKSGEVLNFMLRVTSQNCQTRNLSGCQWWLIVDKNFQIGVNLLAWSSVFRVPTPWYNGHLVFWHIWSNNRLSMHHNTIKEILIIDGNDDLRSRDEQEAVVHRAVQIYMESKGRIKNGPPATKKWNLAKETWLFRRPITIAILTVCQKITRILRVV